MQGLSFSPVVTKGPATEDQIHLYHDSIKQTFIIFSGDWDSVVQNLVKSLNASIMSIPENNVYRIFITGSEEMEEHINSLIKVGRAIVHIFLKD